MESVASCAIFISVHLVYILFYPVEEQMEEKDEANAV